MSKDPEMNKMNPGKETGHKDLSYISSNEESPALNVDGQNNVKQQSIRTKMTELIMKIID